MNLSIKAFWGFGDTLHHIPYPPFLPHFSVIKVDCVLFDTTPFQDGVVHNPVRMIYVCYVIGDLYCNPVVLEAYNLFI